MNFPLFVASVGKVGFLPKAPGTFGSLVGLLFFQVLLLNNVIMLSWAVLFVLFILGWHSSQQILQQHHFHNQDPSFIVIDEVVGIGLTLLLTQLFFLPSLNSSLLHCLSINSISFGAFRLFDIFKPWPIYRLEKLLAQRQSTAAFGIMFDDILAGLAAALLMILIRECF